MNFYLILKEGLRIIRALFLTTYLSNVYRPVVQLVERRSPKPKESPLACHPKP